MMEQACTHADEVSRESRNQLRNEVKNAHEKLSIKLSEMSKTLDVTAGQVSWSILSRATGYET